MGCMQLSRSPLDNLTVSSHAFPESRMYKISLFGWLPMSLTPLYSMLSTAASFAVVAVVALLLERDAQREKK